jgi:hypothetical protein
LFTQMTSAAVSFIPVGGYFLLYRYTPDAYILWSWLYFILPTYLYCMSANTWCLLFHKFLATIYSGIDVNFNLGFVYPSYTVYRAGVLVLLENMTAGWGVGVSDSVVWGKRGNITRKRKARK